MNNLASQPISVIETGFATDTPIDICIKDSVRTYLKDLAGDVPSGVYSMVITAVEKPLLIVIMQHANQNQSLASEYLGINRNTLRKKLQLHGLL